MNSEQMQKIARYECRKFYENILGIGIICTAGALLGGGSAKLTTPSQPASPSQIQEQTTPSLTGAWTKPLKSLSISSHFGMRVNPVDKVYRPHNGIDFRARDNTELYALYAGKITGVINDSACGKGLRLEAGEYQAVYCHMNKVEVRVGQMVKAGERVGLSGNTGRSTGPHLHLGIKKEGRWVNPYLLLQSKGIL